MGTLQVDLNLPKQRDEQKSSSGSDPEQFRIEDYLYYPSWLRKEEKVSR